LEAFKVSQFPLVIAERLLIKVSEQMERLNTHVRTANSAFQEAPEVLHTVCVDVAVNITLGVVNDLMGVVRIKRVVTEKLIGHHFRSTPNVLADDGGKFMLPARFNVFDMNLPSVPL
jgi:hypothetical protein